MALKKLAVVFGSRSAEHDVSIVSGLQLVDNVDKTKYDAFPVYVSKRGEWFVGDPLRDIAFYQNFRPDAKGITRVYLPPIPGYKGLYTHQAGGFMKKADTKVQDIDCAILAFHGMHGEDGTMQGLFELADIPYSSAGVMGTAVGMDKIVMKAVFQSMGLEVMPMRFCYRSQWKQNPEQVLNDMEQLGYPLFVKPANLGSSIGISRAADRLALKNAIEVACHYDRRILVEKALESPREINCAALGYGADCIASVCEQPVTQKELLSFGDKYMRNAKGQGMQTLARIIPAPISEDLTARIQKMTCDVFEMLECKGVVRIDYMLDAQDNVYINEINTIPGSFAFYLFEPLGIKYSALIDKLVDYAYAAFQDKKASVYAYDSELIKKVVDGAGAKGAKYAGTKA